MQSKAVLSINEMQAGQLAQTMVSAEAKITPLWNFGILYASSSELDFFSAAVI